MPFLSVIVPAYNCADTIEKCVNSVLNQSFVDLELLIVDDGSVDATPAKLRQLAEEDGRVRVFTQPNAGVSAARNAGLDHAEGRYVAFLDADDYLDENAYELMISAMQESGADCAACGHYLLWPDGRTEFGSAPMASGVYDENSVFGNIVVPLYNDRLSVRAFNGFSVRYLYPLESLRRRNIRFSGAYLEDELFLIEFFGEPCTLVVVNEGLYYYLQNPNSATRQYMPGCVETFLDSLERKRELADRYMFIPGGDWERNCAWAGLLIAVGNEFAPGGPQGFRTHVDNLKALCRMEVFRDALKNYRPKDMNRRKTLVALLLRLRMYRLLTLLYLYKNRENPVREEAAE